MSSAHASSTLATAADISERRVSAVEVLDSCMDRIERLNPALNAVVTLDAERARRDAEGADRARSRGPLHGVPFTVKDLIATAGLRSTAGSALLSDFVPSFTAPAVERLLRAGAILVGKTNCAEFGLDLHTDNLVFGTTRNPVSRSVTPGGSSGGDSSAVAAELVPFSVGTDLGGSIRWPAHCTGVVGLRATPGLISGTGQLPLRTVSGACPPAEMSMAGRLQVIAPIARRVDDVWALLTVMAGPDSLDPRVVPVPLGDPDAVVLSDLRCAWCGGGDWLVVDQEVREVVERAAEALSQAGIDAARDHPASMVRALELFGALRRGDGETEEICRLWADRNVELSAAAKRAIGAATRASVDEYSALLTQSAALRSGVLDYMRTYPILLWPVARTAAFEVGTESVVVDGSRLAVDRVIDPCRIISVFGLPVAAVPCGMTAEGRPVAVQVVGRPFADHEVIAVARLLESAFPAWDGIAR